MCLRTEIFHCKEISIQEVPKLENNVWCSANVVIAGPVIIEDNVIIAANSFIDKSVPSGAIVVGCPARIIGWRNELDYKIETNPKYKEGTADFMV